VRRIRNAALATGLVLLFSIVTVLAEESTSTQLAQTFWRAFLDGNAAAMGKCYAPRVTLKSGSELLKSEYGLNVSGNRKQDLDFDREQIARAYRVLFERIGKTKWADHGKRLRDCRMTYITQADNSKHFEMFRCQPQDLLVQIHTSPVDLFFAIRQDPQGQWWVVGEAFD
jgi:hypothetical protein